MQCPICETRSELFGRARVLGSFDARYCHCPSCGYLFAPEPVWLERAYASAITESDVGLVDRNLWFSKLARSVVQVMFDPAGRFIDYGGGTGLFTRLMRDKGFDWYWFDTACRNLFAAGFEADTGDGARYELLTAAELFEHLLDPVETMNRLHSLSTNILFTTQLLPDPPPRLGQWWYYGLEHGQHVSFYTRKSLHLLGERFGLRLASNGENLHLFSTKRVPDIALRLVASPAFSSFVSTVMSRPSLLPEDFETAKSAERNKDAHRA